jgi:hypothetical protein
MTIPKAKAAKEKTEQSIALKLETAKKVRQAMEVAALRRQQEERLEKIRPAQMARQRNTLLRKSLEAAGSGSLLIPIDNIEDTVISQLRTLGFRIATKSEDLRVISGGLTKQWKHLEQQKRLEHRAATDYSVLLEPFRKFVMVTIVNAWRSRENDLEHIRNITTTLLSQYYDDLKRKDLGSLYSRFEWLSTNLGPSENPSIKIRLSDLIGREDSITRTGMYEQVMDITISLEREPEFFQITGAAMDLLETELSHDFDEDDLDKKANEVTIQATKELSRLAADQLSISWWSSFKFPGIPSSNYPQKNYWLASITGQRLLERIASEVKISANSGFPRTDVKIPKTSEEFEEREIVKQYLELQGYEVTLSEEGDTEATISITWN